MWPAWMASDVLPHDVYDSGADQAVLDDEGEEIGRGVLDDGAHDVDPAAGAVVVHETSLACGERLGVDVEAGVPERADAAANGGCQIGSRGVGHLGESRDVVLAVGLEIEVAEDVGRVGGRGIAGRGGGRDRGDGRRGQDVLLRGHESGEEGGESRGSGGGGRWCHGRGAGGSSFGSRRRGSRGRRPGCRGRHGPLGAAGGAGRGGGSAQGHGPSDWTHGSAHHAIEGGRGRGHSAGELVGVGRGCTQAQVSSRIAGTLAEDGAGVAQRVVLYAR